MCMTHGHAHHFLFLSLSLVLGAISTGACDTSSSDRAESRSLSGGCLLDCDDGGYEAGGYEDGKDDGYDGGYEDGKDDGYDGGYEGGYEYDDGCTLTQGYWKNHHRYAKNLSQKIDWPMIQGGEMHTEDTKMGGKSWLYILQTPPKGNPWYIAAHQWIAAKLNVASGAKATPAVVDAMYELEKYLTDYQYKPCDGKEGVLAMAKLLDDYNNGKVGPHHCGDMMEAADQRAVYDYEANVCDGKNKLEQNDEFGLKK